MSSNKLSNTSLSRLATCDERLQKVVTAVAAYFDFTVLEGHRGQAAQDLAVQQGRSQTPWPKSKHNSVPSRAVDLAPYPIDWKNEAAFMALAWAVAFEAGKLGIKIRWGGTFKTLRDLPHFELEGA